VLRWLVIALFCCNLAYFFLGGKSASVVPSATSAVANIEGPSLKLLAEESRGAAAASTTPAAATPPSICHMIGPFKEKISARQVKDRLKALDVEVRTYQLQIPEKPDYWVHLGPLRSRKEALDVLRELQSKKIDSFLITEGELLNGISLGFFTREDLAQAVQKQRREQGYEAKIRQVPRFSQQLWAVVEPEEYNRLSDAVWQKVKAGTDGLELRKNSCDLIASAERLD
jgi:cell division septation protein DedD